MSVPAFQPRTSMVGRIKVDQIQFDSTVFIGDLVDFSPVTRAIAVMREIPRFIGNEGRFSEYMIFTRPIPPPIVHEPLQVGTVNADPVIRVGQVQVLALSTASLLQAGSVRAIRAETRVKHVRQLLRGRR